MILKTLRVKNQNGFEGLVRYVLTDEREQLRKDGFLLTHNLLSHDIEGITKELIANDNFREKRRKGLVLLYHEILSFSDKDQIHITKEKLRDIAERYIEIRCPNAMVLAVPHFEKDHSHIHCVISGSEFRSKNKLLRMDNKQFDRVKREIENYQREKYPELVHSIVYTNKPNRERLNQKEKDKNVRKERAYQAKVNQKGRGGKMDKERLSKAIHQMYELSSDVNSFLRLIEQQDELTYYFYRDKLAGVKYQTINGKERKYRFTTLGISKEMLLALEKGKEKTVPTIEKSPKEPSIMKSILSDKELKAYLKNNRAEQQQEMLDKYIERYGAITEELSEREQNKKVKRLLINLLDQSKTMPQFMYFLSKVGFEKYVVDNKLRGVKHDGKVYNFKEIGLGKLIRAKQKEYDAKEKYKQEKELKKDQKTLERGLGEDLFMGGLGFF